MQVGIGLTRIDAERTLVEAARGGDVQAFATLYDRHLERVYRYIFTWIGNQADAETLTQKTFHQAWKAIGRYDRTGAPFVAWLLIIAHGLVQDVCRTKNKPPHVSLVSATPESASASQAETVRRYDGRSVRRAILRLKPEQQHVVVLRHVEQFEYAEIAATLRKSEDDVRAIEHRAVAELQRLLAVAGQ